MCFSISGWWSQTFAAPPFVAAGGGGGYVPSLDFSDARNSMYIGGCLP
jgi:hypothetical protein